MISKLEGKTLSLDSCEPNVMGAPCVMCLCGGTKWEHVIRLRQRVGRGTGGGYFDTEWTYPLSHGWAELQRTLRFRDNQLLLREKRCHVE